jgi:hypothetical protein
MLGEKIHCVSSADLESWYRAIPPHTCFNELPQRQSGCRVVVLIMM